MQSIEITNAFAQKFKEKASPQNALYVGPRSEKDGYTCIFSNFRNITENHHFIDLDNQKKNFGQYDLIVADLPFGTKRKK